MNNRIMLTLLISVWAILNVFSQNSKTALTGNGKIKTIDIPSLESFSAIELEGIPGSANPVKITVGETTAVTVLSDENLAGLFEIIQKNGTLRIALTNNKNNRLWIEDTHIQITIQTPALSSLAIDGNIEVEAAGLDTDDFKVKKSGNGNLLLSGKTTSLHLDKSGNGSVDARQLTTQTATIESTGNGSVYVNATESLKANRSGNGDIVQTGPGKVSIGWSMGNGEVITPQKAKEQAEKPDVRYVSVTLANNTLRSRDFTVRGRAGKSFSYGIEIGPMGRRTESFPEGTKIENKLGKTVYTVTAEDDGKTVLIAD